MFSIDKLPALSPECTFFNLMIMCLQTGFKFFSVGLYFPFFGGQVLLEQTAPSREIRRAPAVWIPA